VAENQGKLLNKRNVALAVSPCQSLPTRIKSRSRRRPSLSFVVRRSFVRSFVVRSSSFVVVVVFLFVGGGWREEEVVVVVVVVVIWW